MEDKAKPLSVANGGGRVRHAAIRMVIGVAVVVTGIFVSPLRQEWHASIHDGLLAGWIVGGFTPFLLAMSTIIASQSRTWQGTGMACLAALTAMVQCEMAAIATALLLSDWYPIIPDSAFLRAVPALTGIAFAAPLMFVAAMLITRRAGRPVASTPAKSGDAADADYPDAER